MYICQVCETVALNEESWLPPVICNNCGSTHNIIKVNPYDVKKSIAKRLCNDCGEPPKDEYSTLCNNCGGNTFLNRK